MQSKPPILLTVARRDPRKGIRYLTEAYAILRKRGYVFRPVIVGPCQLMGPIDDLPAILSEAYCFILPSLEEGGGSIAILEAMEAGLPVITTNIDGIPEDITNGISGILVPPANPQALAMAIEKILKNPRLARVLGRNAKIKFAKKYSEPSVRKNIQKLLKLYDIQQ